MKAISLTQPWATLIAVGAKRIETRSWSTPYRGQIAIHASKGFPAWARETCFEEPFRDVLAAHLYRAVDLPLGAIVALADLVAVVRTEEIVALSQGLLKHEIEFGDYAPGRYGFVLQDVRPLKTPVFCTGKLGLWDVPADVVSQIAGGQA